MRAVAQLSERHPNLRYLVIGDGPERETLGRLAVQLGVADRVELAGQLPHAQALERTRRASILAMPSTDEAFGVAYVEAMAGWLPAIGATGEPGPEEIRSMGGGMTLVAPGDVDELAGEIDALLSDPRTLRMAGDWARATVVRAFSWERCGAATVAAYEEALRPRARAEPAPASGARRRDPLKPVLLVTNHVPPERAGAFAALHRRHPIELAIFGGRSTHATAGVPDPGVPHRYVGQREIHALAASTAYGAVICGTAGRTALPASWLGARRARVPFVLWTALWAHPRTPAHLLGGAPLLATLYRDADAIVAYGPHVAAFVRARGARNVHVAPQAVDNAFWSEPVAADRQAAFTSVFLGRPSRAKGAQVLLQAWRSSGLGATAALVLVGAGSGSARVPAGGAVSFVGPQQPIQVRNFLAAADVLIVPSLRTRDFREPWGLVANEAMNQSTPIIASDEVGAVAGGLVRHERNGLVVKAGDAGALAAALRRLHDDPRLRARLGANARRDVFPYTFESWAAGFAAALRSLR